MGDKPWLRSWPDGVPQSIEYPMIGIFEFLMLSASKHPGKPALISEDGVITYGELDDLTDRFAYALRKMGVEKGGRVALYLPNTPSFIISLYGVWKAGAAAVPCNVMYKQEEMKRQLKDSRAEILVTVESLYPIIEGILGDTSLRWVILVDGSREASRPGMMDLRDVIAMYPPEPPSLELDPREDIALLQYTGGTTGVSKGAMLTHYNIVSNILQFKAWLRLQGGDIHLAALPLFHIFGLTCSLNTPLSTADTVILLQRFHPEKVLEIIQGYKVTVFCGVPTMYIALINHPEALRYDLTSLRLSISGGAPLPLAVRNSFKALTGGELVEGYGLTEASPVTHCNPPKGEVRPNSIGMPLPSTDAKIVDLEGGFRDLSPGEVGELAVRGPQVMKGYWGMEEETGKVLRDGWLLTGDIARMDGDGYFYLVDRKKDMINVSGFKVWPREVEDILYDHPAIKEAAVIGIPDPYQGEKVKAFVVLRDDYLGRVQGEDLIEFCRRHIASYKIPHIIEFREELPKTSVGKVLRRALREK